MIAAGLPLKRPFSCIICAPISTRATSFRRTTRAVGFRAHDDVSEFLGRRESALGAYGVGEFLPFGRGFAADLSRGVDRVLGLHRLEHLGDRDVQLRELVGLDPEPHRVLARAKHGHARDPGDAGEADR